MNQRRWHRVTRRQKQTGRGETLVDVWRLIIYQDSGCVYCEWQVYCDSVRYVLVLMYNPTLSCYMQWTISPIICMQNKTATCQWRTCHRVVLQASWAEQTHHEWQLPTSCQRGRWQRVTQWQMWQCHQRHATLCSPRSAEPSTWDTMTLRQSQCDSVT